MDTIQKMLLRPHLDKYLKKGGYHGVYLTMENNDVRAVPVQGDLIANQIYITNRLERCEKIIKYVENVYPELVPEILKNLQIKEAQNAQ